MIKAEENRMSYDELITYDTAEVNGVRLFYAAGGEGRPVILVHGNGESHKLFKTEIGQLINAGYRVYAPDSRGQGENEPLKEYHYADMAEDMYQFIKKLGLEKPALYGFSDGGIIGLMLEISHPGSLGILAVSGANLSPEGVSEEFRAQFEGNNDPLVRLMFNEPHIDPSELKNINIPVLATAGSRDLIVPSETQKIAENLPDCECVIVEGEDHGSYIVDNEFMGELLIKFLKKHGY